jgi:hypothetical protein
MPVYPHTERSSVLYDGPLYTFFDPADPDKSMVFGTELDGEQQLYVAMHVEGTPYLRNAVYGKRYGAKHGEESAGKRDKRSFMYLSREAAMELYDLLGGIFGGVVRDAPMDMEDPLIGPVLSINDMLEGLEE